MTGNIIENGSIFLGSEISGNLIAENKISNGERGCIYFLLWRNNTVSGNTISNCSLASPKGIREQIFVITGLLTAIVGFGFRCQVQELKIIQY